MKKILVVITIILALVGLLFASPILGKEDKSGSVFYGTAYAGGGGGEI